ncbi:MAG TPA: hypothetical protein DCX65_10540, partial [Spirochaetaceae bacterium]|nr:hypothetical protein [Spirochaetaceae bacterium]
WVCFYGGWDEGLAALPRKAMLPVKDPDKKIRYFNFSMLLFVALAALATFTAVYCAWLCPFKLITEFDQVTNGPSLIAFVLLVLTFFGFVVVLPLLTKKRAQCMSFCPFGAFQSLADKLSLYRVRIDPTLCNGCQACLRVCPTLSIHEDCLSGGQHQAQGKVLLTCTKCGLCMAACSRQAIRYEFTWQPCTPRPGRFEPTIARLRSGKRLARALAVGLSLTVELSDPKALLPFSGWLFGCIIMGGFAVNTVTRLLNLVLHGSFLFN